MSFFFGAKRHVQRQIVIGEIILNIINLDFRLVPKKEKRAIEAGFNAIVFLFQTGAIRSKIRVKLSHTFVIVSTPNWCD